MTILASYAPAAHDWLPAHRGVDFATSPGMAVRAVRRSTVVVAAVIAGRPIVVLRSGAVRFTHEPVVTSLRVGERVRAGQVIGAIGSGGHCGTTCLHWGAKVNGAYVDPLSFLPHAAPVLKPVRTTR